MAAFGAGGRTEGDVHRHAAARCELVHPDLRGAGRSPIKMQVAGDHKAVACD
jgi:hypothetical protein